MADPYKLDDVGITIIKKTALQFCSFFFGKKEKKTDLYVNKLWKLSFKYIFKIRSSEIFLFS